MHFVLGEDLEDAGVIDRHAREADVDAGPLHVALAMEAPRQASVKRSSLVANLAFEARWRYSSCDRKRFAARPAAGEPYLICRVAV